MTSPIQPTIGRVVIVSLPVTNRPQPDVAEAPGLITHVTEGSDTICVTAFPRGWDSYPLLDVPYSEEPIDGFSWHWMAYQVAVAAERDPVTGAAKE